MKYRNRIHIVAVRISWSRNQSKIECRCVTYTQCSAVMRFRTCENKNGVGQHLLAGVVGRSCLCQLAHCTVFGPCSEVTMNVDVGVSYDTCRVAWPLASCALLVVCSTVEALSISRLFASLAGARWRW